MPINKVCESAISCEDESKRTLLRNTFGAIIAVTVTGTAGFMQQVLADEVKPANANAVNIPYRESELGINYRKLAPSPLAEMLSQGEAEWLKNATEKYGEKTGPFWERSILVKLATGAPSESIIEKIKSFTPEMLRNFSKLDHRDPKYGRLSAEGSLFGSSPLC